ncbi:MAG: rRNA pseudouridine synthase [Armatimonadetes bacterium]|nr:rRNA pseudouridine synthase [Armatimonadota bacterium]
MEERLQKVLAAAGVASRRHCETLITTGRVAVDGRVVTELGTKVDPDKVTLTVDGKPAQQSLEKTYILLNKPPGYTSTRSDPHAKHTVLELVRDIDAYLYPVGRLDVDTSGLLILTNDGELTKMLTHPSHEVEKTYLAVVTGRVSASGLARLERGVKMEDGVTSPARARLVAYSRADDISTVELVIREGRKRQVRRMFEVIGHEVLKLSRTRLGNLDLKGLAEGRYRRLTRREVTELRKLATPQRSTVKPATRRSVR